MSIRESVVAALSELHARSATCGNDAVARGCAAALGIDGSDSDGARRAPKQRCPVLDVAVIYDTERVPQGYVRLQRTERGERADLNRGSGGRGVYLCVRYGDDDDGGGNVACSVTPPPLLEPQPMEEDETAQAAVASPATPMHDRYDVLVSPCTPSPVQSSGAAAGRDLLSGTRRSANSMVKLTDEDSSPTSRSASPMPTPTPRSRSRSRTRTTSASSLAATAGPISALMLIVPALGDFLPPGFSLIGKNLNRGNIGPQVYLCCRRDRIEDAPPITDLQVRFEARRRMPWTLLRAAVAKGGRGADRVRDRDFVSIDRTPTGALADASTGTGGAIVHVMCRKCVVMEAPERLWSWGKPEFCAAALPSMLPSLELDRFASCRDLLTPLLTALEVGPHALRCDAIDALIAAIDTDPAASSSVAAGLCSPRVWRTVDSIAAAALRAAKTLVLDDRALPSQLAELVLRCCGLRGGGESRTPTRKVTGRGVRVSGAEAAGLLDCAPPCTLFSAISVLLETVEFLSALGNSLDGVILRAGRGAVTRTQKQHAAAAREKKTACSSSLDFVVRSLLQLVAAETRAVELSSILRRPSTTTTTTTATMTTTTLEQLIVDGAPATPAYALCRSIVDTLIERVTVGACIESTLKTAIKDGSSATSTCSNFLQCAFVLFPELTVEDSRFRNVVITVALLSKVASEDLMPKPSVSAVVRRVTTLEALIRIVESTGAIAQNSMKLTLVMRRFVVTAVCSNLSGPSLQLEKIFRLVLRLITVLWQRFRTGLKIELAVLWKELLARLMSSDATGAHRQVALLKQLAMWCQVGGSTVDLFLNFDNDHTMGGCDLLRELADSMSALAHTKADEMRAHGANGDGNENSPPHPTTTISGGIIPTKGSPAPLVVSSVAKWKASSGADDPQQLQSNRRLQALKSLSRLLRSFMDASATLHLMVSDKRVAETAMSSGWADDTLIHGDFEVGTAVLGGAPTDGGSAASKEGAAAASAASKEPAASVDASKRGGRGGPGRRTSISMVQVQHAHKEEKKKELKFALEMAKKKESLVKPIQYLCDTRVIQRSTPPAVATFLREYNSAFPTNLIGDYLGERGKNVERQEWMEKFRRAYIQGIPFRHVEFCEAFRRLLTEGGFQLPVEGQKISRIIEAFADVYIRANPDSDMGDADSIYVFAYSVLMLNTDLHNPRLAHNKNRRERHKRMTKVQFIARNRLSPELAAISDATMSTVYDNIERKGIELPNFVAIASDPASDSGGITSSGASQLQHEMKVAMRQAQAVLDEQAFFDRRYASEWTADLVRLAFQEVWFSGKDAAEMVLNEHADDVEVVLQCLELLKYMLSAAIFLELKVPAQVFAKFLKRIFDLCGARDRAHRAIVEESGGGGGSASDGGGSVSGGGSGAVHRPSKAAVRIGSGDSESEGDESSPSLEGDDVNKVKEELSSLVELEWFQRVLKEEAIDDPADAVADVHKSVQRLGNLWRSQAHFSELVGLQQCFDDSSLTLLSTTAAGGKKNSGASAAGGHEQRHLIMEGTLLRRCAGGTRRDRSYHFFLFSDMLVYAKRLRSGNVLSRQKGPPQFHAQQVLSLDGMHVTPAPPGFDRPHAFCVHSAVKSFPVAAPTEALRDKWVKALSEATRARRYAEAQRKGRIERRERLSVQLVAAASSSSSASKATEEVEEDGDGAAVVTPEVEEGSTKE